MASKGRPLIVTDAVTGEGTGTGGPSTTHGEREGVGVSDGVAVAVVDPLRVQNAVVVTECDETLEIFRKGRKASAHAEEKEMPHNARATTTATSVRAERRCAAMPHTLVTPFVPGANQTIQHSGLAAAARVD